MGCRWVAHSCFIDEILYHPNEGGFICIQNIESYLKNNKIVASKYVYKIDVKINEYLIMIRKENGPKLLSNGIQMKCFISSRFDNRNVIIQGIYRVRIYSSLHEHGWQKEKCSKKKIGSDIFSWVPETLW